MFTETYSTWAPSKWSKIETESTDIDVRPDFEVFHSRIRRIGEGIFGPGLLVFPNPAGFGNFENVGYTVGFFILDRYWNCFFEAFGTAKGTKNRYMKSIFLIFSEFRIKKIQIFLPKFFFNFEKIRFFFFKISIKISKILHPMHLILSN